MNIDGGWLPPTSFRAFPRLAIFDCTEFGYGFALEVWQRTSDFPKKPRSPQDRLRFCGVCAAVVTDILATEEGATTVPTSVRLFNTNREILHVLFSENGRETDASMDVAWQLGFPWWRAR